MHSCPECPLVFVKSSKLDRHYLSVHSDERPFICPECQKSYKRKEHLAIHTLSHASVEDDKKPFKCQHPLPTTTTTTTSTPSITKEPPEPENNGPILCSAAFSTKYHLTRHIRLVHECEKPFQCPECHLAFSKQNALRRHMCLHTGKHPYPCTHASCSKSFLTAQKLDAHLQTHEISNRSYMCGHPGCGTTTSKWSDLRAHIQQQHPPTCPACSKTFKSRSNLKSHLKATAHDSTTLAQLEARGRRRRKRRNRRKVRGVGWESVEASTSAVDDEEADEEDGNDDDYGCGNPGGLGDTSSNYQSTFSPREAFLRQVFVCKMEGCGHSVATAYALRVHQRNKHENARPFPCKECGMAFGYKNVLHRHVRNIHHYPEGSGALDTLAVGGGVEVAGSCVYTSSIRNDQIDNLDDYIPTELVPNLDSTDACKDYTPPKKTQPEEEKSTTKPLPATPSTIITSSSGITPHLPYHTHTLENINLLADITGFKYDLYAEETGRTLSCPVDPIVCIQKFKREWDVYRHVCAIHPEYK